MYAGLSGRRARVLRRAGAGGYLLPGDLCSIRAAGYAPVHALYSGKRDRFGGSSPVGQRSPSGRVDACAPRRRRGVERSASASGEAVAPARPHPEQAFRNAWLDDYRSKSTCVSARREKLTGRDLWEVAALRVPPLHSRPQSLRLRAATDGARSLRGYEPDAGSEHTSDSPEGLDGGVGLSALDPGYLALGELQDAGELLPARAPARGASRPMAPGSWRPPDRALALAVPGDDVEVTGPHGGSASSSSAGTGQLRRRWRRPRRRRAPRSRRGAGRPRGRAR